MTSVTTQKDLIEHIAKVKYDSLLQSVPEGYRTLLHTGSQRHASAWKTAPPKAAFMLDHVNFEFLVRRSLRVQIIPTPIMCPNCCKHVINIFGDHALHCAPGGHLVFRHNDAYRLVVVETRAGSIGCSVEAKMNLSAQESYRPDFTLSEPIPGLTTKATAVDFTVTNPFAKSVIKRASNQPLKAAQLGRDRKVKENTTRMSSKGFDFLALAFEATGGCTSESEKCIDYILSQKSLVHNLDFSEVAAEFWQSLSICMQRSNARAIRERVTVNNALRLPPHTVENDGADYYFEDTNE